MNTRSTRANEYPPQQSQTGPSAGQAARHPIDAARGTQTGNQVGGTNAGNPGIESYGRGGTGNMGTAASGTGMVDPNYRSGAAPNIPNLSGNGGLQDRSAGQNYGNTGADYGNTGAGVGTGTGQGYQSQSGAGTHVPGMGAGQQSQYGGTGDAGLTSHGRGGAGNLGADAAGVQTGTGLGTAKHTYHSDDRTGADAGTMQSGTTHTGDGAGGGYGTGNVHTGSGTRSGAHTGTHTGTDSQTGSGGKATIGEKIKGTVEQVAGKIQNDPERVAVGQQLKEGNHPSQKGEYSERVGGRGL
jgi:hypothetical protein